MYRELSSQGVKVPNGFAITAEAYRFFLRVAQLDHRIQDFLRDLNTHEISTLRQRGRQVRQAILSATLPPTVAHIFDERDAVVKTMIAHVIQATKAKGRKIGICGQAPSDYPEFAQFLVEQGIDSISLNPDAVLKTLLAIADMGKRLEKR